jgi:hypothetical protein
VSNFATKYPPALDSRPLSGASNTHKTNTSVAAWRMYIDIQLAEHSAADNVAPRPLSRHSRRFANLQAAGTLASDHDLGVMVAKLYLSNGRPAVSIFRTTIVARVCAPRGAPHRTGRLAGLGGRRFGIEVGLESSIGSNSSVP